MSTIDIITAAKNGDIQTVINCINYGVSVDARDKDNATPLYWGCCRGHTKLSAELIKLKPDVNAKVTWGSTALHASCDRGHIACVTLLIQSGTDLDIQNKSGNTALHLSAYRGNIEIVRLLVQHGANVFLRNEKGRCAAEEAEVGSHRTTAQFLHRKMQDYESKWKESESRVHSCPEILRRKFDQYPTESAVILEDSEKERCLSVQSEWFSYKSQNESDTMCSCGERNDKSCDNDVDISRGSKVMTTADDRESLVTLVEKLQLQIVKANEEIVQKDRKIKELTVANKDTTTELGKYRTVCKRLNEQKTTLEEKMKMHSSITEPSDHVYSFLQEVTLDNPSCSFRDSYFQTLKQRVKQKCSKLSTKTPIDIPMKEWFPGTDYVVNGDRPIKSEKNGVESLTFLIKHLKSGKFCDLKMTLLNDNPNASSYRCYLLNTSPSKVPELSILSGIQHRNIMDSIHIYHGTTDRFHKFLSVLVPQPPGASIPRQAFFLVTEHYPHTLQSFITAQRGVVSLPPYGLSEVFLCSMIYQMFSGICYMRRFGFVHRDLHSGNVYMTERFCPVLGNFEMAMRVLDGDDKQVELHNTCQIMAGNSNAWAPELLHYKANSQQLISNKVTLRTIYDKSDIYAIGRMLHTFLLLPEAEKEFNELKERNPFYKSQEIPELPVSLPRGLKILLRNTVCSSPSERLGDQDAKLFIGILLFAPKTKQLSSIEEVQTYFHSRMLSLLAKDRVILHTTNTLEEIQRIILPELESDFLSEVANQSYFAMYNRLCSLKCLHQ